MGSIPAFDFFFLLPNSSVSEGELFMIGHFTQIINVSLETLVKKSKDSIWDHPSLLLESSKCVMILFKNVVIQQLTPVITFLIKKSREWQGIISI